MILQGCCASSACRATPSQSERLTGEVGGSEMLDRIHLMEMRACRANIIRQYIMSLLDYGGGCSTLYLARGEVLNLGMPNFSRRCRFLLSPFLLRYFRYYNNTRYSLYANAGKNRHGDSRSNSIMSVLQKPSDLHRPYCTSISSRCAAETKRPAYTD